MATHSMKDRLDDLERRRNEALHPAPERTVQAVTSAVERPQE